MGAITIILSFVLLAIAAMASPPQHYQEPDNEERVKWSAGGPLAVSGGMLAAAGISGTGLPLD